MNLSVRLLVFCSTYSILSFWESAMEIIQSIEFIRKQGKKKSGTRWGFPVRIMWAILSSILRSIFFVPVTRLRRLLTRKTAQILFVFREKCLAGSPTRNSAARATPRTGTNLCHTQYSGNPHLITPVFC